MFLLYNNIVKITLNKRTFFFKYFTALGFNVEKDFYIILGYVFLGICLIFLDGFMMSNYKKK
jgi:hypothetical protein